MFGGRPDWVLVGLRPPDDDGVVLVASRDLRIVDLKIEYEDDIYTWAGISTLRVGQPRVEMSCQMAGYAWVKAPDYGTAFQRIQDIFREWDEQYRPIRVKLPETTTGLPEQPALPSAESPGRY
jgi:hypothetical protein